MARAKGIPVMLNLYFILIFNYEGVCVSGRYDVIVAIVIRMAELKPV